MTATLRVWWTSGQLGAAAIGAAVVVAALIVLAVVAYRVPVLTIAAGALLYGCAHVATGWTIDPRPACRPGRSNAGSTRAPVRARRHRAPRHAALGWSARPGAPHTSAAATLAPTTGRPAVADPGAPYSPAAASPAASPLYAAAGSTSARAEPVGPTTRFRPGRAAVGGAR